MRVVKKGNVYRKAGWYRRNERQIWETLCAITGIAAVVFGIYIGFSLLN